MKELERGAPLVENLDEQGDAPEPEAIRSRGVSLLFSAAGTSRRCASDKTNRTRQIGFSTDVNAPFKRKLFWLVGDCLGAGARPCWRRLGVIGLQKEQQAESPSTGSKILRNSPPSLMQQQKLRPDRSTKTRLRTTIRGEPAWFHFCEPCPHDRTFLIAAATRAQSA